MSNCDCQENIKKSVEHGPTVGAEKPIGDGLFITTVVTATIGIFFILMAMGLVKQDKLLASTSLVWLISLPVWQR